MNKVMLSLFKNHNMMFAAADDYVYDDLPVHRSLSPNDDDDVFGIKDKLEEELDLNKVLRPIDKCFGIKGMETGNLATLRFKYGSPFNRCSKPTKLDPNAIEFDPNNKSIAFDNIHQINDYLHSGDADIEPIKEPNENIEATLDERIKKYYNEDDDSTLALNGFRKIKKLQKSLQGHIYLGETILARNTLRVQQRSRGRLVIIKQTNKFLHNERECMQNGCRIVVDEDIVKEANILQHLTVKHSVPGSVIPKIIEFVESDRSFYLIMRHAGNLTLKEFVDTAHDYIQRDMMSIAHWKKICKYISWQIVATLHWMHNDMNCMLHICTCIW